MRLNEIIRIFETVLNGIINFGCYLNFNDMNKKVTFLISSSLTLLVGVVIFQACSTVPITGRKQLSLVPESDVVAMGLSSYSDFLKEAKISNNVAQTAMVKNSGKKIAAAVNKFLTDNGMGDRVSSFQWEFNLIEDDSTVNAWCMPGGKVAFYTGIMPICQDENGVAVVMGHEIAHAVARHGAERMSQDLGVQMGGATLQAALAGKSPETQGAFMTAYGVSSQVGVLLPYSRTHETEADKMGLIFIAMAGYDPSYAVDFWKRMAANGGGSTMEILSTHPSDATRIKELESFLPEAMKYYKKQ